MSNLASTTRFILTMSAYVEQSDMHVKHSPDGVLDPKGWLVRQYSHLVPLSAVSQSADLQVVIYAGIATLATNGQKKGKKERMGKKSRFFFRILMHAYGRQKSALIRIHLVLTPQTTVNGQPPDCAQSR